MPLHLRTAQASDLDTLLGFQRGIVEYERPMDPTIAAETQGYYDVAALIEDENTHVLLAELDGQPIGCCLGQIRPGRAWSVHDHIGYIGMVFVAEAGRGQGICAKMFAELEVWFRQRGIRETRLQVYTENPSAIRAYERAGMQPSLIEMRKPLD